MIPITQILSSYNKPSDLLMTWLYFGYHRTGSLVLLQKNKEINKNKELRNQEFGYLNKEKSHVKSFFSTEVDDFPGLWAKHFTEDSKIPFLLYSSKSLSVKETISST